MKGYSDLANLPEDKRIEIIGRTVVTSRQTVAVAIDDEPKKVARYIRKLNDRNPGLLNIEQVAGVVPNTVTLRVAAKPQNAAQN
jgi:hypothetical protein